MKLNLWERVLISDAGFGLIMVVIGFSIGLIVGLEI